MLIHSLNTALYPILILSIIGAGGISAHTNPAYTQYELEHAVRITRPRLVLSEPEDSSLKPMLKAMQANKLNPNRELLVLDTLPTHFVPHYRPSLKSWRQSLLEHGSEQWTPFSEPNESQTTVAALFLSSGTTGLPKAAALTHHNLIAQHQLIYGPYTDYRSRSYSTSPRMSSRHQPPWQSPYPCSTSACPILPSSPASKTTAPPSYVPPFQYPRLPRHRLQVPMQ